MVDVFNFVDVQLSGRHTNIIQCSTLKYTLKNDSCTVQHIYIHCKGNLFSFMDSKEHVTY